jgi:short-subunit dehydrogenase
MTDNKHRQSFLKTILITGASSGIGAELARQLAAEGHRLALAARRQDRLEILAEELTQKHGIDVLVCPTDVTQLIQVTTCVQKVWERFGRLDVLVNNAGVLKMQPFVTMPIEDMKILMNTNFWGSLQMIRATAPFMAKQGGGHILQVGSGVSRRGLPFMAVYSATKFALTGLTESLRLELKAQGIDFTLVYPGGVDTEMPASVDPAHLPPHYHRHTELRIPATQAARAIVRAIQKRPLEIYVPRWVRAAAWMSVLFPRLTDFFIHRAYCRALP